jgi:hypothetical protein
MAVLIASTACHEVTQKDIFILIVQLSLGGYLKEGAIPGFRLVNPACFDIPSILVVFKSHRYNSQSYLSHTPLHILYIQY